MESKTKPESAVDPPRRMSYEDSIRARREAAKAKMATPVVENQTPPPQPVKEKFELPKFNMKKLTMPNFIKEHKLSMPKFFKKKEKEPTSTTPKEKKHTMPKLFKSPKLNGAFSWLDRCMDRLCRSICLGIITAIALNIITKYFWPELPTKIPTIYEFFNGFLTVGEFLYKTALGGIASIFKGTFLEFCDGVNLEIKEMWNAFCTWMSSIRF